MLFQHVLGFEEAQLLLDVVLHAGTLGAILIVFGKDILTLIREAVGKNETDPDPTRPKARSVILYLMISTAVTGVLGLALHDVVEGLFTSLFPLSPFWVLTGCVLLFTRWRKTEGAVMGPWGAVIVGLAQAMALAPGVSRSGITIAVGLLLGWDRKWAATYSFLMSIPAILGAVVLETVGQDAGSMGMGLLLSGGVISLVVGLVALRWLLATVNRGKLHLFAWYCFAMGIGVGIYCLVSG